jgi:molybdenum cofactor cytidylyltransferase
MGRPKLLLPWSKTSILGHLLEQWRELGAGQIAVVCSPADGAVQAELDRLGVAAEQRVFNPAPARGMFSSIQCGARWAGWKADLSHFSVALGDQPHLRLDTLRALLDVSAANPARVCQPARNGRGRHPVVLPRATFAALAESSAADLKAFLRAQAGAVLMWESDDPGLDFDIDEPVDYERALRLVLRQP